jgi:hypothetical protein
VRKKIHAMTEEKSKVKVTRKIEKNMNDLFSNARARSGAIWLFFFV